MAAILTILGAIGVFVLIAVISAYPVMWGVNAVFTPAVILAVFGVPQLGFVKALWLSVLCACLFHSSGSSSSKK